MAFVPLVRNITLLLIHKWRCYNDILNVYNVDKVFLLLYLSHTRVRPKNRKGKQQTLVHICCSRCVANGKLHFFSSCDATYLSCQLKLSSISVYSHKWHYFFFVLGSPSKPADVTIKVLSLHQRYFPLSFSSSSSSRSRSSEWADFQAWKLCDGSRSVCVSVIASTWIWIWWFTFRISL